MNEICIEVPRGYTRDFEEFENKGWKKFKTHSEATILLVVQEFYANVKEQDGDYIFVKSKKVRYNHTTINKFFRLSDLVILDYNSILGKEFDA